MVERAFRMGLPVQWITADRSYGDDHRRWLWLAEHEHADVLAGSGTTDVGIGMKPYSYKAWLTTWPDEGWTRWRGGE
jgi:hypothetical protein